MTIKTKSYLTLALVATCLIAMLPIGVKADSATDTFRGPEAETTFRENWKTKMWAARGAGPTGKAELHHNGLRLVADASAGGQPSKGFTLTTASRVAPFIRSDANLDVTIGLTLANLDATPYGTQPAAKLVFGISGDRGTPSILARIGSLRVRGVRSTHVEVIVKTVDGEVTLASAEIPDQRVGRNSELTFSIQPTTIDLQLKGRSLIDGPIQHRLDFGSDAFKTHPMTPIIGAYKFFGKKGMGATIAEFTIAGESVRLGDNDIIGDQLGSTAFLAEPVFTIDATLTPRIGRSHRIAPGFFGINGNLSSLGTAPWDNENFAQSMRDLRAGHIRYPAGTIANYWDWNIGWLEQEVDSSQFLHWTRRMVPQKTRYTLENFAKGQREVGFEPVYVMNMVTRDLEDMLKQLRRAKAMGMPITYVELGNEYYFGIGAEPLVHVKYPTPEAYAKAANEWAAAITKEFPEAKIAAVGTAGVAKGKSERRQTWNKRVAPLLSDDIDAMTMHPYSGIGMFAGRPTDGHWGNEAQQQKQRELLRDPAAVQHAILTPTKRWLEVMSQSEIVTKDIWATEFNTNDWFGGVRQTWTQTLALGAAYDGFLRDDRVKMVTYHNAVGSTLFQAVHQNQNSFDGVLPETDLKSEPWTPSAGGLASKLFATAGGGREQVTAVDFGEAASQTFKGIDHPIPMVRGWVFSDSKGALETRGIVLNFTPEPVTIETAALGETFADAIQTTSQPDRYIASPADLVVTSSALNDKLELAPYSFTILK